MQQEQQLQDISAYRLPVIEEDSESQSEWEPGEADDADVVYQWERFDERGRPLQEPASQQQQDFSLGRGTPPPGRAAAARWGIHPGGAPACRPWLAMDSLVRSTFPVDIGRFWIDIGRLLVDIGCFSDTSREET